MSDDGGSGHHGTIERSKRLTQLRYLVQVQVPPEGLGARLGEMHAWALKRCGPGGYLDSGRTKRDRENKAVEFVLFHFPDAAAARDFAAACKLMGAKVV